MKRLLTALLSAVTFHILIFSLPYRTVWNTEGPPPSEKQPVVVTLGPMPPVSRTDQDRLPVLPGKRFSPKRPKPETRARLKTEEKTAKPPPPKNISPKTPKKPKKPPAAKQTIPEVEKAWQKTAPREKKGDREAVTRPSSDSSEREKRKPNQRAEQTPTKHPPVGKPKSDPGRPSPAERSKSLPVVVHRPHPEYPRWARRKGWEGSVWTAVLVGTDGRVREIRIVQGSGHSILDQAAREAIWKWRFHPGKMGGKAAPMWVRIPIRFQLPAETR